MYKLFTSPFGQEFIIRLADNAFIPIAPENSDYANFKREINEGAELQDADGNTMTAEQAKDFVKELP